MVKGGVIILSLSAFLIPVSLGSGVPQDLQFLLDKENEKPQASIDNSADDGDDADRYRKKSCQDGWDYHEHSKKCYKKFIYPTVVTWMDAQQTCRQFGGDLPIIRDDKTNKFVTNLAGKTDHWIGAYRVGKKNKIDNFVWVDVSSLTYENFSGSGPDNYDGNEFCTAIFDSISNNNGQWNDFNCWSEHWKHHIKTFVCQRSSSSETQSTTTATTSATTQSIKACFAENTVANLGTIQKIKKVENLEACNELCTESAMYGEGCQYFNFKDNNKKSKRICYLLKVDGKMKKGFFSGPQGCS